MREKDRGRYTHTGRSSALLRALGFSRARRIIEVGGLRNASQRAKWTDGWSTLTFVEWTRIHGGGVVMVEPRPKLKAIASVFKGERPPQLLIDPRRAEDREEFDCDLLYLDGPNRPEPHLHAVKRTTATVVAFDDVEGYPYGPKHQTSIPWLLDRGWQVYAHVGRVMILNAPEHP